MNCKYSTDKIHGSAVGAIYGWKYELQQPRERVRNDMDLALEPSTEYSATSIVRSVYYNQPPAKQYCLKSIIYGAVDPSVAWLLIRIINN
jgi:hypothetical protein